MRISVTQEHINKGKAESCHKCPVALAIAEHFPNQEVAVFGPLKWIVSDPDAVIDTNVVRFDGYCRIGGLAHPIPSSVSEFIDRFDHGKPVEPFEFELD